MSPSPRSPSLASRIRIERKSSRRSSCCGGQSAERCAGGGIAATGARSFVAPCLSARNRVHRRIAEESIGKVLRFCFASGGEERGYGRGRINGSSRNPTPRRQPALCAVAGFLGRGPRPVAALVAAAERRGERGGAGKRQDDPDQADARHVYIVARISAARQAAHKRSQEKRFDESLRTARPVRHRRDGPRRQADAVGRAGRGRSCA